MQTDDRLSIDPHSEELGGSIPANSPSTGQPVTNVDVVLPTEEDSNALEGEMGDCEGELKAAEQDDDETESNGPDETGDFESAKNKDRNTRGPSMIGMQQDLDLLQGTWQIESLIVDGRAIGDGYRKARLLITGNRFQSLGMDGVYEGVLRLDETTQPRQLDMTFDAGPEKGNTNFCLYEIRHDQLRLCIASQGSTRPDDFISPPGSGIAVEVLRRTAC